MKKELNYLSSKRWEKVWRQELRSTPYKQEIDPWYAEFLLESDLKTFTGENKSQTELQD
jgi:hypothetical protein